jgi:hypothetical protein
MHPEIKKYWEKFYEGEEVIINENGLLYEMRNNIGDYFVIALKFSAFKTLGGNPNEILRADHQELQDDDWIYPFGKHFNDEAAALKMLKLKIFL